MKTSLKLLAALAILTGFGGSAAIAMQGGPQKHVTYFYDDEEHTNIVGGTLEYCNGSWSHFGSYTLYTSDYYFTCP
ncbi:MAG: hypothetical protein QOD42_2445 [Sphingomonadales bacterium]|nr:hypothetical protein [Sphingomonadales bacterium]